LSTVTVIVSFVRPVFLVSVKVLKALLEDNRVLFSRLGVGLQAEPLPDTGINTLLVEALLAVPASITCDIFEILVVFPDMSLMFCVTRFLRFMWDCWIVE